MLFWADSLGSEGACNTAGYSAPAGSPLGECIGCQVLRLRCLLVLHVAAG